MAIGQQNITTAVSILQIGISRNTKCVIKDGFHRDSHIYKQVRKEMCSKLVVLLSKVLDRRMLSSSYAIL